MSTNVYKSEQLVHYAHKPVTYFGWYISWSGGEDDTAYPFNTEARRVQWLEQVRAWVRGRIEEYDTELLAAMLAVSTWGPESSREGVRWAIVERYKDDFTEEEREELDQLAHDFDPSEEVPS